MSYMNLTFILILYMVMLSIFSIYLVLIQKYSAAHRHVTFNKIIATLDSFTLYANKKIRSISNKLFLALIKLNKKIVLSGIIYRDIFSIIPKRKQFVNKYSNNLKSRNKTKRIVAASILGYFPYTEIKKIVLDQYINEKDYSVKLYLLYSLEQLQHYDSIEIISNSLIGTPDWFRKKAYYLLFRFKNSFFTYALNIIQNTTYASIPLEIKEMLCEYSTVTAIPNEFKMFLLQMINDPNPFIKQYVCKIASMHYPELLINSSIHQSKDTILLTHLIIAFSQIPTLENIHSVLYFANHAALTLQIKYTLSIILEKNKSLIFYTLNLWANEANENIKNLLAEVLYTKLDFMLPILTKKNTETQEKLLVFLVNNNKIDDIINFLNRNKNIVIEDGILKVLKPIILNNDNFKTIFSEQLLPAILQKLGLMQPNVKRKRSTLENNPKKNFFLYVSLIIVFILLPLFPFFYQHISINQSFTSILKQYISAFNHLLAVYFIVSNIINTLYVVFAEIESSKQKKLWESKSLPFLFTKNILPSVSILVPAYCEEKSIIESVNSLMNLNYPDYEIIVVNDGSSDKTLERLIEYYELEKHDILHTLPLRSEPIRGLYYNQRYPNLIVIDKYNGGKADALNAGISLSRKEFICTIDSDSVLEQDGLLKIASATIDDSRLFAIGGSIFPANSAKINKGSIEGFKLSKNILVNIQIIEYLRAFLTGRLGSSYINNLFIISGAFGLFNRSDVIKVGGYLTKNEKFHKDTVGEDMEIVVRMTKIKGDEKKPFRLSHIYNTFCWTEVPSTLKIMYKQRDRWQRGLIDILSYHLNVFFKRKYKTLGLLAFPFYYIFDVLGPLIETIGMLTVIASIVLSISKLPFIILLIGISILYGSLVSIIAISYLEKDRHLLKLKQIFGLIFWAIVENFGIRFIISFFRVTGFFNSFSKEVKWGKMERKGFSGK